MKLSCYELCFEIRDAQEINVFEQCLLPRRRQSCCLCLGELMSPCLTPCFGRTHASFQMQIEVFVSVDQETLAVLQTDNMFPTAIDSVDDSKVRN